jgi:hypothetical protein
MGLMRMAARTAVVAGTATAVSNRVSRRQATRWSQQGQQEQYAEPEPEPAYQEPQDPTVNQLQDLAALRDQGILTDEEFAAKKKQILGI